MIFSELSDLSKYFESQARVLDNARKRPNLNKNEKKSLSKSQKNTLCAKKDECFLMELEKTTKNVSKNLVRVKLKPGPPSSETRLLWLTTTIEKSGRTSTNWSEKVHLQLLIGKLVGKKTCTIYINLGLEKFWYFLKNSVYQKKV